MKKIMSLIIASVMIFSSFAAAFAVSSDITVGKTIYTPADADEKETYAANLLCEKLNVIFGGFSVSKSEPAEENCIIVGHNDYSTKDAGFVKPGSYCIDVESNRISIEGNGNDGLINGVYEFLSRFCDYEVYEKNIITYTDSTALTVPADTEVFYEPFFEYRKVDTTSSYNAEYCRANSINSNIRFASNEGDYVEYISNYGHTLTTEFCSANSYFDSHPEYFALHDGARTKDQLCLTNPDVLRIITDEVLDIIRVRRDPDASVQIVSLTQNDNTNYCECENCKAIDDANGSHAGTVITFVNKIADTVKEKGYDNIAIDTFAYQYSRTVPTNVVPKDNVIVRLCSIECCFAHAIDEECPINAEFLKDLEGWGKICDRLYVWDYVNNYSETFLPFPNFNVLQRNVQIFYENGAKGLYEEGNYYMDLCDGEFYELRSYLLCKLMENPYREDYDELMLNYLNAVYGPGGKYLMEYIKTTSDLAANHRKYPDDKRLQIRQQPKDCLPGITNKQIRRFDELWKLAQEEAENEQQLERIGRSEVSWEYWKCCRYKGKYTLLQSPYKYMKSHVELLELIEKYGNTSVGEASIKYLRKNPFRVLFLSPVNWESKFDGKFYDKLDGFAKWLYELMGGEYNFDY